MLARAPKLEFWDEILPQLVLAPLSVPVADVLRCFEDASALRAASPESLAEPDYRDLGGWAQIFARIDLWFSEDVDARCRALTAALIAEASPEARLQLFHLIELWAWAYAPDVATQIEDSLRPHFDLERGVELDPGDALRVLASVCTLLGAEHGQNTGLVVVVDDEAPPSASAQVVVDRLIRRGDVNHPRGLQVHGRIEDDGKLIDPPKLYLVASPERWLAIQSYMYC